MQLLAIPLSALFLIAFGLFFSHDLMALKRYMAHPEFITYYPSFRHWFHQNLLQGKFPQWNPYWGLGHSTEIASSFPIDMFSPLELLFGPQYPIFQGVQACVLLLALFWSFRQFNIHPLYAVFGSLLFLLSPWVNYFFYYYLKPPVFITLILATPLLWKWFDAKGEPQLKFLYAFTGVLLVGYFGMKLEYLFFLNVYFLAVAITLSTGPGKSRKLAGFGFALVFAVAAHAWQWIPLLQILKESNRLENPMGFATFASKEFYQKFGESLLHSPILRMGGVALIGLCFPRLLNSNKGSLLFIILIGLSTLAFPFWKYFYSSFGLGVLVAILYLRFRQKCSHQVLISTMTFFLPIAYYWCRPSPGDIRELTVLHLAPRGMSFLYGLIWFFGSSVIQKDKRARACFLILLFLYFMRDQGQILLAFTSGAMWIPTRDNFIFDFTLTLLSLIGLSHSLTRQGKTLGVALIALLLFSNAKNWYYSNDLIRPAPPDFPYITGVQKYRDLFRDISAKPLFRGYLFDFPESFRLPQFGTSLFEKKDTVHLMSSLISKRYRNWTIFQRYGFRPEAHWGGYENEYTAATIRKLPSRNSLGIENTVIYWNTLHAFPPANPNALRILGVTHLYFEGAQSHFPGLTDYRKIGAFQTARLEGSLPRAFTLPIDSEATRLSMQNDLDPTVETHHIRGLGYRLPFREESIEHYGEESVSLKVNIKSPSVLVLGDLYHSFWRVRVDGEEAPIFPALYLFRGVKLEPGSHRVEYYCAIPGLKWGFWFSLSLFCLFVVAPFGWRRYLTFMSRMKFAVATQSV